METQLTNATIDFALLLIEIDSLSEVLLIN